ncbi:hypothetical protein FPF71_00170 [Algibacter amylolyticus]|uniref:Phage holin family protein n=1 Tax=Algibacter amylolyticus TaxID=1608400 RepID=A0A5M7BC46_9FLAO|nr:hypothetical protein [Algibacter amylolyticus]KAA5827296.1 hypothetical protein F2B50_00170 [Algibacter amylolyticus]MBB5266478.1 putative membrane protein YdbT with pleckstrin-like domain [Algibacter amylolyticus]TSJ81541.1 hypothetical protein FPF71_00170 [Algibacter amylolyticus]
MSLIDSISETNAKASDVGERYFKTSYEYYKLKIFQQLSISTSLIFKIVIIGGLLLIGLSFSAIALAFLIGKALESYTLGFVIVGILFLCLSLIAYFLRKHINNYTVKILSEKFFN